MSFGLILVQPHQRTISIHLLHGQVSAVLSGLICVMECVSELV
jgi:hypothetical protein